MDRLTYRLGEKNPTYGLEDKASAKVGLFTNYDGFYAHLLAVHKLGQYEDTGLTPVEIVKLQLQVKKHNNLAAEYGIDGETMLALAESKIKTSADNVELREQLSESERQRLAAVEALTYGKKKSPTI